MRRQARARPRPERSAILLRGRAAASVAFLSLGVLAAADTDTGAVLKRERELSVRGDFRGALALLRPIAEAPGLAPADRIQLLSRVALAHANLSDHDAALAAATKAEGLASQLGDPKPRGLVAHLRGELARLGGNGYQAIAHYQQSLGLGQRAGDADLVRRSYRGLAAAHQQLGDWGRVLDYARRAFESHPNPDDGARISHLFLMGVAHYEFRERDAAEQHFRDLLELAEHAGRRREVALALDELALLYWEFDRDRSRALAHHERALALARELGLRDVEATGLLNSGNVYRDGGDLEEALRRYREALTLKTEAAKNAVSPVLTKNIGQVLARLGRAQEAESWLRRAKDDADRLGTRHIRWEARMELDSSTPAPIPRAPMGCSARAWTSWSRTTPTSCSRTTAWER